MLPHNDHPKTAGLVVENGRHKVNSLADTAAGLAGRTFHPLRNYKVWSIVNDTAKDITLLLLRWGRWWEVGAVAAAAVRVRRALSVRLAVTVTTGRPQPFC